MMPLVIETKQDFIEREGGPLIPLDERGENWLARSGATMTVWNGRDSFLPPPQNTLQCLQAQQKYHQLFLQQIEESFMGIKRMFLTGEYGDAPWPRRLVGDAPRGGTVAALKKLAEIGAEQKKKLATIDAKLAALPEMIRAKERQAALKEVEAQDAARRRAERDAVAGIEF